MPFLSLFNSGLQIGQSETEAEQQIPLFTVKYTNAWVDARKHWRTHNADTHMHAVRAVWVNFALSRTFFFYNNISSVKTFI